MKQEEVKTLELPEGTRIEWDLGWKVWWHGDTSHAARTVVTIAVSVANGNLPRSLHDWAMRAYKGGEVPTPELWDARGKLLEDLGGQLKAESDWRQQFNGAPPTPEQWKEAVRLAETVRADAHPDSIRAMMANIISPPKPPPLPEIEPCPYCGGKCGCYNAVEHGRDMAGWYVSCQSRGCPYVSPPRLDKRETVTAHNDVARKLKPEPQPEPVKRTCGNCRHEHARASVDPCASCRSRENHDNWEPKP
jgi:hypothetical protein